MSDGLYERLMKIAWFLVLIALQAACTNASTAPESTQSSTVAHSPTNSPHPSTTSTPSPTGTFTATSTVTATSLPTFTLTASSTPSPTAEFGLCPIDMAIENSRITIAYDEFGYNYDLWAPHGTSIRSPGECSVISLFIASNGTQGLHVSCSDYPLNLAQRISYAHIDLAWNDYETLKIYGIPIETFFDTNGNPKLGVENVPPGINTHFHRGDSPVAFVGNTGDHQMPYHLHIDVWSIQGNQFSKLDPSIFFNCES